MCGVDTGHIAAGDVCASCVASDNGATIHPIVGRTELTAHKNVSDSIDNDGIGSIADIGTVLHREQARSIDIEFD